MSNTIAVTAAVLTYNPDSGKLLSTLCSLLCQKGISLEIVIADDGSAHSGFAAAQTLLEARGFRNYRFVENPVNRGTVFNVLSAVENSSGKYIKLISPGDLLASSDTLCQWVTCMEKADAHLSFCDAVYYTTDNGKVLPFSANANPQNVRCYQAGDLFRCRYNYLICGDLFLGAATLCRRQTLLPYLQELSGKVVYAEDNAYRLMAYDEVPTVYFEKVGVIYESGLGVSTSGSDVWRKRLQDDWEACSQLLLRRCSGRDPLDKALLFLTHNHRQGLPHKLKRNLLLPRMLLWKLQKKCCPRKTAPKFPQAFLTEILPEQDKGAHIHGC